MNNICFKKLFLFLIILITFTINSSIYSSNYISRQNHFINSEASFSQVPPQLRAVVAKIMEMPEARSLLAQVTKEGPVGIVIQNDSSGQFDALWDGDARLIKLNPYRHANEGSWICSILFELHNASTNRHMLGLFQAAEQNRIAKESWVEQMERMEHANALKTCQILDKGIGQGIYPVEARWTIFNAFDDYYKLQQISGHSHWLADMYDAFNQYSNQAVFQGTIQGLSHLTPEDKKDLEKYLVIKNSLESSNQAEALKNMAWLKAENARLDDCLKGKSHGNCFRTREKINLMRVAGL